MEAKAWRCYVRSLASLASRCYLRRREWNLHLFKVASRTEMLFAPPPPPPPPPPPTTTTKKPPTGHLKEGSSEKEAGRKGGNMKQQKAVKMVAQSPSLS